MAPFFKFLAVALPSLLAWGMAVWGAGQLRWGLASSLSVGLFTACLSLKVASFAQVCNPFEATEGDGQQLFKAKEGVRQQSLKPAEADGHQSKLVIAAAPRRTGRARSSDSDSRGNGPASDDTVFVGATGAATSLGDNLSSGSGNSNGITKNTDKERWGGHKGGNTPIDTPTPALSTASPAQLNHLTFWEFIFFLLTAPALVCEPRFLKVGARQPPRVIRAASELFHAGLAFLSLHAACSALVALTFRVLAAASANAWKPSAFCDAEGARLGESDWVDVAGWAALETGGSGGWFHNLLPEGGEPALSGGGSCGFEATTGWVETAAALAWGMFVFSPLVHFTTFYGFWHCVCLGCAELWGYPDRNLYGETNLDFCFLFLVIFVPELWFLHYYSGKSVSIVAWFYGGFLRSEFLWRVFV